MSYSSDKPQYGPEPSHSSMFVWLFAIATIWHYSSSSRELYNYWLQFDPVVTPLIAMAVVTAFIAAVFPNRTPAVLLFAAGQVVAISVRFPFVADHLVMELFLNLSILLSFVYLAIKRRSVDVRTDEMFELFSPVGRWLLIVMYFFGTFHKFNPGFMSLESSCALPFISGFPMVSDAVTSHAVIQYAAIYGTLIVEALAMVLLLSTRTKYYGMLLGMPFHFLIGISGFGTLAHFSAFALALHTLFLPSTVGQRIRADGWVPAFLQHESGVKIGTIIFVLLQVLCAVHLSRTWDVYLVNSLFAVFGISIMFLVARHGKVRSDDAPYRLRSPLTALNALPVLFFLHCTSPYIGLGTGGALTMFSGLRTEGGVSNHYVIQEPIRLFPYQDTVVYFESATNDSLRRAVAESQGLVMFDFQRHFTSREPLALPLVVKVDGNRYTLDSPESVGEFGERYFTRQSWLERKYMSFRLVDAPRPDRCRH
jgi:hypothetical protein